MVGAPDAGNHESGADKGPIILAPVTADFGSYRNDNALNANELQIMLGKAFSLKA
jgi:hypothetical protein